MDGSQWQNDWSFQVEPLVEHHVGGIDHRFVILQMASHYLLALCVYDCIWKYICI